MEDVSELVLEVAHIISHVPFMKTQPHATPTEVCLSDLPSTQKLLEGIQ